MTNNDASLLRRYVREGSQEAFAEFVARHADLVYGAALRRLGGHVHRAQDVTQHVFTDVARKAEALSRHPSLAGWLYVSAHHASAALMRAEQRRQAREQEVVLMNELNENFESVDWERLSPILEQATLQLSPEDREAVLLRFMEKRRYGEIAAALLLSEDGARHRVDRALEKLRRGLARHGVTSTAAALSSAMAAAPATGAPAGFAATVAQGATLAAASGTGASGAALFGFMSTGKIMMGVGTVLLITALGGAVKSYRDHIDLGAQLAAAEAIHATELKGVADARNRRMPAAAAGNAAAASAASIEAPRGSVPSFVSPNGFENGKRLLAAHPELLAAHQRLERARPLEKYGALIPSLGLTPEGIQLFLELKEGTTISTSTYDGTTYGFTSEIARPAQAGSGMIGVTFMTPREVDADLQSLLGTEGYQKLQAFDAAEPARDLASNFAGQAALAGSPLSSAQFQQVAQMTADGTLDSVDLASSGYTAGQISLLNAAKARAAFKAEASATTKKALQAAVSE